MEQRLNPEQQVNIEALTKKLYEERPIPDYSQCWGLQPLSPKKVEEQKGKNKRKKTKRTQQAPNTGVDVLKNLRESQAQETHEQLKRIKPKEEIPFGQKPSESDMWKVRLEKVLEGEKEREDRPYSKEEILAMGQKEAKNPSVLVMYGLIQLGPIFPSYEEMTVDECSMDPAPWKPSLILRPWNWTSTS